MLTSKGRVFYDVTKLHDNTEEKIAGTDGSGVKTRTASDNLNLIISQIQSKSNTSFSNSSIDRAPKQGAFSMPENTFMDEVVNPGSVRVERCTTFGGSFKY